MKANKLWSTFCLLGVLLGVFVLCLSALSVQAQVTATRQIATPGNLQWGDSFNVTVTINVQNDIDGLVLDEDLEGEAENWGSSVVSDETTDNFTYSPILVDWANTAAPRAGQTLVVRYRVTLPAGTGQQEFRISGTLIAQQGLTQTTIAVGGNAVFVVGGGTYTCCDLVSGWNLISLPVQPDDPDPRAVFTADPLYLCRYNAVTGTFDWVDKPASAVGTAGTLTAVSALGGYWLASQNGGQYCVSGTALTGNQVVAYSVGWHMIGVPYDIAWGNATGASLRFTLGGIDKWLPDAVAAGWIYGTILNWDATATPAAWVRTTVEEGTTLVPCLGYWIRTRVNDLTMTFTTAAWDPGNPPSFSNMSMQSEDPGNPPMPVRILPLTFDASKLEFGIYPNPGTDAHPMHFQVMGEMVSFVDAIEVDIYDLSGKKVYSSGEVLGTSVDWDMDNSSGEYLANGVYLCKMFAKAQGQWVASALKKIVIIR